MNENENNTTSLARMLKGMNETIQIKYLLHISFQETVIMNIGSVTAFSPLCQEYNGDKARTMLDMIDLRVWCGKQTLNRQLEYSACHSGYDREHTEVIAAHGKKHLT